MHDLRTIFRNSLLFCVIAADFCVISLTFALDTTYEVGGVTRTGEFIPNPAGANGSKSVYAPNSAAKMPNGTRIPYGLRGTLRTGSKLFKQLLIAEAALETLDWVKSQYSLTENETINTDLEIVSPLEFVDNICNEGSICGWSSTGHPGPYSSKSSALAAARGNCQAAYCTLKETQSGTQAANPQEYAQFNEKRYNELGQLVGERNIDVWGNNTRGNSVSTPYRSTNKRPAGEPNRLPDTWQTGQIVEYYAAKIPQNGADGWEAYISPNVQILDQPIRWTELPAPAGMPTVDTVTDLIRVPGYEPKPPALIPDPEPLRPDPDGLKKIPNPLLQGLPDPTTPNPPPAVRTKDLIGGGMTVTNTYNITNNATQTRVELNLENKEITYTQDDSELEVPADLTVEEIDSNMPRLKIPVLEPEKLVDAAFNAAGGFIVPDLLDDKSDSCPPPRTLAIIGGATVQMPFDPLCDFLAMIKKVFVPVVGWIIFLMWIRRIGSS